MIYKLFVFYQPSITHIKNNSPLLKYISCSMFLFFVQVPAGVSDADWKVLSDSSAPVSTLVQTVTHIVATLLKSLQEESQQISLSQGHSSPGMISMAQKSQSSPGKEASSRISPNKKQRSPGVKQSNVTFGSPSVSPTTNTRPSLTSMKTLIL